jgi:hypothetical protein
VRNAKLAAVLRDLVAKRLLVNHARLYAAFGKGIA